MLLVAVLREAGLRIILSNMLTISGNLGRAFRSFCQQSSISWCSTTGQSMGAGSLKSCSMALITCSTEDTNSLSSENSLTLQSCMKKKENSENTVVSLCKNDTEISKEPKSMFEFCFLTAFWHTFTCSKERSKANFQQEEMRAFAAEHL